MHEKNIYFYRQKNIRYVFIIKKVLFNKKILDLVSYYTKKAFLLMASSSTLTYVYRASYQQHPSVCMCISNHACVQDTFMWIPTKIGNFVQDE